MKSRDFSFPPRFRLKKSREYEAIYEKNKTLADEWLKIYYASNSLGFSRMGMAVSRRMGPAVERNYIKRLFREAFRLNRHRLPLGYDFILIPRFRRGNPPSLPNLEESLLSLTQNLSDRQGKGDRVFQ